MTTIEYAATSVVVRAEKSDDPNSWIQLRMETRDGDDGIGWLAHSTEMNCRIEPLDDLARTYALENWESGLQSGCYFVCRKAKTMPPPPLRLSELIGSLGAGDMEGVVRAGEAAIASILDIELPLSTSTWTIHVRKKKQTVPEKVLC